MCFILRLKRRRKDRNNGEVEEWLVLVELIDEEETPRFCRNYHGSSHLLFRSHYELLYHNKDKFEDNID